MQRNAQLTAWLALASVCFFWGTTYLGIRMALESFAPMALVSIRFLLSGSVLLLGAVLTGATIPRGKQLWRTSLFGILVLGMGNGCLVLAETWIPSGIAALIITISPFWLVGLDSVLPNGERLHGPTLAAMCIGLVGAVLLVAPGSRDAAQSSAILKGFLVLQLGSFCWNLGSLMQRREVTTANAIVVGAVQQFAAGVAFLLPALITWQPVQWSTRGVWALLYLVVFGSIVGYTSFIIAMERLPVSVVSIYNYVNPVVAVILGWMVYREPFGRQEALAMFIIFVGVALMKRFSSHRTERVLPEKAAT